MLLNSEVSQNIKLYAFQNTVPPTLRSINRYSKCNRFYDTNKILQENPLCDDYNSDIEECSWRIDLMISKNMYLSSSKYSSHSANLNQVLNMNFNNTIYQYLLLLSIPTLIISLAVLYGFYLLFRKVNTASLPIIPLKDYRFEAENDVFNVSSEIVDEISEIEGNYPPQPDIHVVSTSESSQNSNVSHQAFSKLSPVLGHSHNSGHFFDGESMQNINRIFFNNQFDQVSWPISPSNENDYRSSSTQFEFSTVRPIKGSREITGHNMILTENGLIKMKNAKLNNFSKISHTGDKKSVTESNKTPENYWKAAYYGFPPSGFKGKPFSEKAFTRKSTNK